MANQAKMNPRLGALVLVGIVLSGAVILWFRFNGPSGSPARTFPADLILYYYPMTEYAAERVGQGDMPLWNPYSCCGIPFLATAQVALFYPGTWLALVLPIAAALKLLMFCETLLAGLFAGFFFRALGASHFAAGLGGVIFIFTCVLGHTLWPPMLSTIMWMPFLMLCIEKFVDRANWKWWAAFTAGTTLQILAGFPQFMVITFYLLGLYAAVRLGHLGWTRQLNGSQCVRRCAGLAFGCVLAVGLSGLQLLPTLELVRNTDRGAGLDEKAVHYLDEITGKELTATGAVHNAFDPTPKWPIFAYLDSTGYLGMATLPMIGLGVILERRRYLVGFFLATAVVFGILSFGYSDWSAGLYRLYAALPTGTMFRTPGRFRLLTFFSLISLAVLGIDQCLGEFAPRGGRWWQRAAPPLAVAVWLIAVLRFATPRGLALAAVVVGLLVASRWLGRHQRARVGVQVLLCLFMLLDLAWATRAAGSMRHMPVMWGRHFWTTLGQGKVHGKSYGHLRRRAGLERVAMVGMRPEKPIEPTKRAYAICDYEPLVPRRWTRANRAMGGIPGRVMFWINPFWFSGFYDMASVRFIVFPKTTPTGREPELLTNFDALPRAYLVGRFALCTADEALSHVVAADFDYQNTVLLEDDPGFASSPAGTAREPARIVAYEPERVVITTDSQDERLLVLTDTWFPGWKAFVDGEETEVLRANYLFRAVRVSAGVHEVEFTYAPASFRGGLFMSAASLGVFMLVCGLWARISNKKRTVTEP